MATWPSIPVSLKSVGEFLGVTAGGGAGAAALAFGIGFLATKHHDAMLGVPTTTTDHTTYVRTGALFFSQTLHDMVAFIASIALWVIVISIMALMIGLIVSRIKRKGKPLIEWKVRGSVMSVVVTLLVLISCLIALPYHLAALDPGNKNLLFERRPVTGTAAKVGGLLRSENREADLHRLYGKQCTRLLLLALGFLWARRLVQNAQASAAGGQSTEPGLALDLAKRVLQPVAAGAVIAMTATTPANYGVLAMSTSLPCVQLFQSEQTALGMPGFLLSDLSSESAKIAVLRWDNEEKTYFVDFHLRDSLRLLAVRPCPVRNPIHQILGQ